MLIKLASKLNIALIDKTLLYIGIKCIIKLAFPPEENIELAPIIPTKIIIGATNVFASLTLFAKAEITESIVTTSKTVENITPNSIK